MTPNFIANLVLNTGVNANWLLTGHGDMFAAASSAVEPGMGEVWSVQQSLGVIYQDIVSQIL